MCLFYSSFNLTAFITGQLHVLIQVCLFIFFILYLQLRVALHNLRVGPVHEFHTQWSVLFVRQRRQHLSFPVLVHPEVRLLVHNQTVRDWSQLEQVQSGLAYSGGRSGWLYILKVQLVVSYFTEI